MSHMAPCTFKAGARRASSTDDCQGPLDDSDNHTIYVSYRTYGTCHLRNDAERPRIEAALFDLAQFLDEQFRHFEQPIAVGNVVQGIKQLQQFQALDDVFVV